MSIPESFIAEVRDRVTMSTLVGRTVKLQKAGREFKACCPFHQEKSASFYVNDDKGFAHCFGCAWNGDAIKWLTDTKGVEFIDALRELAEMVGLQVPAQERGQVERERRDSSLHGVMAQAAEWFARILASAEGERARAYLTSRGVTPDQVRRFGVGFAPDSRGRLRQALAEAGDRDLVACGLLIAPDSGGDPYDRFRGRIMFPIRDARGRVVSFGGRILGQGEPKYLNGPDTTLFDKGRTLFNLDRAGPVARKAGRIVVVEGYMDAVGLDRVDLVEAVAPMGTALTEAQLERLWKLVDVPTLCFDGDQAGRRAAIKAATRALPMLQPGQSLRVALLPEGSDPDDLARSGGRKGIDAVLDRAMPLHELIWSHEYFATPLDTPEARAGLAKRLQDHAETIGDDSVRREYATLFRDRMFPARRRWNPTAPAAPTSIDQASFSPERIRRKMLVALFKGLARHPDVLAVEAERVADVGVPDDVCHKAREMLFASAFSTDPLDAAALVDLFPEERGWKGFILSFNRDQAPGEAAEKARADLIRILDAMRGEPVELEPDDTFKPDPPRSPELAFSGDPDAWRSQLDDEDYVPF